MITDKPLPTERPIADAGGPYRIKSGERLRLDGSGSREWDGIGGIIRWIWDLGGDGMFDEAEGNGWKLAGKNWGTALAWPLGQAIRFG